jgi:hypothetical protein
MQIGGPMQVENAKCNMKMAAINFNNEDILQAIEFKSKAIIILERLLGLENPLFALIYAKLAMYYHTIRYYTVAFDHM